MSLLLDSHTLLWWCDESGPLSATARRAIEDQDCLVSTASFWELAIKISLAKLTLPGAIDEYFPAQMELNGFTQLPISLRHIARSATLPFHHRDPFDRMLVAQSLEERIPIVSRDPVFTRYGAERVW